MALSSTEKRAKELSKAVSALGVHTRPKPTSKKPTSLDFLNSLTGLTIPKKKLESTSKPSPFVARVEGGARGSDGAPGKDAVVDHEEIYQKVLDRLKKEKPLVVTDLKDGQAFVFNNTKYQTHEMMHGAGSSSGSNADGETPSGLINSSNTVYTLVHTPSPAFSLQLYLNGALQQAGGGDYTLSSATITFNSAPLTGSILLAWYRY